MYDFLKKYQQIQIKLYLIPAIVFLSVFIVRFTIAGHYAVNLPFWDQWDAELTTILVFKNHNLTWEYLFSPHNEHRIFFPRLYWILMYCFNHSWGLLSEAKSQTIFIAVSASLFSFWLIKDTGKIRYVSQILIFCLFSLKLDIENIISGFQVQFYLLFLFTTIGLRLASSEGKPNFSRLILIVLACLCAFFSMAAGALLPILVGVCFTYYAIKSGFRNRKFVVYAIVMFLLLAVFYCFIPVIPGHQVLKVKSIGTFLSYVFLEHPKYILSSLPIVVFLLYHFYKRRFPEPKYNFAILLYVYYVAVYFLCIYQRGGVASRYSYLVIASGLGFVFLIDTISQNNKVVKLIFNLSKLLIIALLLLKLKLSLNELNTTPVLGKMARTQLANVTKEAIDIGKKKGKDACYNFLTECQQKSGLTGIPYPSAERLSTLLTTPEVLDVMPKYLTNKPDGKSNEL